MDLSLPDGSVLDLLKEIEPNGRSPEVVIVTGQATVGAAVEALRLGATDYLATPVATLSPYAGNKKKASEVLKISLKTLYNRLDVYKGAGSTIPS